LVRQLSGRSDAKLRRELDRFFAARRHLSDTDRAPIARAMARFRNQLLHLPRSSPARPPLPTPRVPPPRLRREEKVSGIEKGLSS
jgi:hypothetical protein